MTDDRGNRVEEAGPSFPVEVTGLTGVPDAGDTFHAVEDEKIAKDVAQHRQQKLREAEFRITSYNVCYTKLLRWAISPSPWRFGRRSSSGLRTMPRPLNVPSPTPG